MRKIFIINECRCFASLNVSNEHKKLSFFLLQRKLFYLNRKNNTYITKLRVLFNIY